MPSLLGAAPGTGARAAAPNPAARQSQGLEPVGAHGLLTDVGFLLVPGRPFESGRSYLMVALRQMPTLQHFDPERIEYWALVGGRSGAEPSRIEWPADRHDESYGWGTIRIVDRLGAANRFVSFGGRLTVSRDVGVHAALFRSDAPILSLAGHSGPADPLATNIAAYFATLRAASGTDVAFARAANQATPISLYAAFLTRAIQRCRSPLASESISPRLVSTMRSESRRLELACAADHAAGRELQGWLDRIV